MDAGLVFTTRKGTPIEPRNINPRIRYAHRQNRQTRIRFMIFGIRQPPYSSPKASIFSDQGLVGIQLNRGVTRAIYVDVLREVQRDAVHRLSHLLDTGNGSHAPTQMRSGSWSGPVPYGDRP
jgi:hypothetical protein